MSDTKTKIYAALKLISAIVLCLFFSLIIYLLATPFIFGAWHCPSPPCNSPDWIQWTVFLILVSPLLVFTFGAYLCRKIIESLSEVKLVRGLIFAGFALFPLILWGGLIVYIINTP